MKKSKLLIAFFMVMVGVIFMSFTASAETYSGNCGAEGDNVTWSLDDETGVLIISGTGAMENYDEFNAVYSPWKEYSKIIYNLVIEEGITYIGNYAFAYCGNLKTADISNTVNAIGESAFAFCTNMESVTIPSNVICISPYTFSYCENLKTMEIPENVSSIGEGAFSSCFNLKEIVMPAGVKSIGEAAFSLCINLKAITIPESVESLGMGVFTYCFNLENVKICNEIIGEAMFVGCASLSNVEIPQNVKSISSLAFALCCNLKEVYIYNPDIQFADDSNVCCDFKDWLEYGEEYLSLGEKLYVDNYNYTEEDNNRFVELQSLIFDDRETITPFGTIYGYSGSTAEAYADEYGINFVPFVTESTDEETDINASFKPDTFPVGTVMLIDKKGQNADGTFNGKYEYYESFDISFIDAENKEVQPNGTVTIRILVPQTFNPEKTVVYYLAPDGTATKLESWHEGKYIVFETDHFSEYVIVDESSEIIENTEIEKPTEKESFFKALIDFIKMLFDFVKNLFK